jgi:argininosuccinate lyase
VKLWGGNYAGDPDAVFWEFNRSFSFDRRLLAEEIAASQAYVRALERCGAIPKGPAQALEAGLGQVLQKARTDPAYGEIDAEDVHSFVETRLFEIVGDLAGQAHLGRSRNEQAVTALRLWTRTAIDRLLGGTAALVTALVEKGRAGAETVMPGYTHTRAAEPITFGHLAAAHAWALVRDHERLRDARGRVDVLPLGSGALAGTSLPLDREALARDLGFAAVSANALDAVMDRDFAAEFVFACAQLQTHLARLAEDLIAFSGPGYGFLTLPEAFTTGSSLMPQKKNPDALELVRGKAARVDGDLLRLLILMKGLPAGYQKDLQEDKEAVFDAADTAAASLAVMKGVVSGLGLIAEAMRRAAQSEEMMAAGLAVALAREGMPFRRAHALVGSLVAEAQRAGSTLRETAARALPAQAPAVAARLSALFDPEQVVRTKAAPGGTAPDAVRAALAAALARVGATHVPGGLAGAGPDASLPGGNLIQEGLEDLKRGVESVPALVVSIGAPRLRRLGLIVPSPFPTPEFRLYERLRKLDSVGAHTRYNELLGTLVSFERAAAWAN